MPSDLKAVLALLRKELNAMDLEDNAANSASPLDKGIVDEFLKNLLRFDKQQVFSVYGRPDGKLSRRDVRDTGLRPSSRTSPSGYTPLMGAQLILWPNFLRVMAPL